jgi:hypothetical protein
MRSMAVTKPFRDQCLDGLANNAFTREPNIASAASLMRSMLPCSSTGWFRPEAAPRTCQTLPGLAQSVLQGSKVRHVAHNRERERLGEVVEWVQHDVDRKHRAIRTSGDEVETLPIDRRRGSRLYLARWAV